MNKCIVCGKEFQGKRKTAKYCSDACKMKASRGGLVSPIEITSTPKGEVPPIIKEAYDVEKARAAFNLMGLSNVTWITTGIEALDRLIQIPRGRVTQIQGPYGVGKTTLCLNMIAGLTKAKRRVLYIDAEMSLNPDLLTHLQIDPEYFELYNKISYYEDICEIIREASKSGKYDIIIFDSLAVVTTRTEAEGKMTDANIGVKAKMTHKLMHLIVGDLKNTNTALVVINQEREVIGSYVPQKYTPGGQAVPFAASLILTLKTIPSWRFPKDAKNGRYQGHEVEVKVHKSRVGKQGHQGMFKLYYPTNDQSPMVNLETGEIIEPEPEVQPQF